MGAARVPYLDILHISSLEPSIDQSIQLVVINVVPHI